jgi:hypothetical protein
MVQAPLDCPPLTLSELSELLNRYNDNAAITQTIKNAMQRRVLEDRPSTEQDRMRFTSPPALSNISSIHGRRAMAEAHKLPLVSLAEVQATSEEAGHPIIFAFDDSDGSGATSWKAGTPGEQTITVSFRQPCRLAKVTMQVEEREVARTQEVQLAVSTDAGMTYRELLRQEFTFSPDGATREDETWTVQQDPVTHVRLVIKPDKGRSDVYATLTTFGLWVVEENASSAAAVAGVLPTL